MARLWLKTASLITNVLIYSKSFYLLKGEKNVKEIIIYSVDRDDPGKHGDLLMGGSVPG